jgi:prepilin peptidase CpaA
MSLAGGLLTGVMWARHRLSKAEHQLEIPYGVAIAIGSLWLIGERFLNQFA